MQIQRGTTTVSKRLVIPRSPGVYFLRSGTKVKIGHAANLFLRTDEFLIAHPPTRPPRVMAYVVCGTRDDASRLERELHRRFKANRLAPDREWFTWTEEMERAVRCLGGVVDRTVAYATIQMGGAARWD